MPRKYQLVFGLVLFVLAGCNFSRESDEDKLLVPVTVTVMVQEDLQDEQTPTPSPVSTVTIAPVTMTPRALSTATPSPSKTSLPPPPTRTPIVTDTHTPAPVAVLDAQVCSTCSGLRLRETPGTAGEILVKLEANHPLTIIGRTADNSWTQVVLLDGRSGWVATQYLEINLSLDFVDVTGDAEDAPVVASGAVGANVNGAVSGVSSNARAIYLDGLAKGNIPYVFTRVGDSISASPNFLTPIGQGNYNLGDYGYLEGAISFFSGPNGRGINPFMASSVAVRTGWSTNSVLNPANGDPQVCQGGETPLECEYRLVKPSVALIMFGTNDSVGMSGAVFQANLQTITQKTIAMGVIPVLSTIPPKQYSSEADSRVFEFNQIIIATARAYDVPLWDYYSAMASIPGQGLAPDGVHPSAAYDGLNAVFDEQHMQYGYPMRNFTALQVLYAVWQGVLYGADQTAPSVVSSTGAQPGGADGNCSSAPAVRLTVGQPARITPGAPNKVRSNPGTGAAQLGSIPGEAVFNVIGGPQCSNGYRWWQVDYQGLVGWTASGDGEEYWVEPYS